jgi:CheY-like chemotaxis protein
VSQKKRILLVDDSPTVLIHLENEFSGKCDVVTAQSGEEAIQILEDPVRDDIVFSNQFDLIITDLNMPGISGLELSQFVRKKSRVNRFIPVILLTTEKISKEEIRKHGCSAYFSKADKQRLVSMVKVLLSI